MYGALLVCGSRLGAQAGEPRARAFDGGVHFAVSCRPQSQRDFDRAVSLLHSFWYEEAEPAFRKVAASDPACAMAWWGVAMSRLHPLWDPPTDSDLVAGRAAVAQGTLAAPAAARERDYLSAIGAYYDNAAGASHRARIAAYEHAMRALATQYPADTEARIFAALATLGRLAAGPRRDTTVSEQRVVGETLEALFARAPRHPGLAHYIIHADDTPSLAARGLPAARAYLGIAPTVPHALHMPSHIFTLLGLWDASIASNTRAAAAARAYEHTRHLGGAWNERLHCLNYLIYAYLQQGREREAASVLADVAQVKATVPTSSASGDHALAEIPARYAAERERWAEAAHLVVRPAPDHREAEAITYGIRALGAIHLGDRAAARVDSAALAAIGTDLDARAQDYWARTVDVARLEVGAWLAHAEGHDTTALTLAAQAADLEDSTPKSPAIPAPVISARMLQGELLYAAGHPALALASFERALTQEPNRRRTVLGAARAARAAGDTAAALRHYEGALRLFRHADRGLPELAESRTYVASHAGKHVAAP
jgi:tetratricopeptide (TPR) repeat protein